MGIPAVTIQGGIKVEAQLITIANRQELLDYFQGKIRFELNIDSKAQIRLLLGVSDNRLLTVLSSNANPILTVFNEAIRQNETTTYHSDLKEYMMALLIKDCHNDLEEVFEHNSKDWRDMYNDIIEPSTSVWSPISGGYDKD